MEKVKIMIMMYQQQQRLQQRHQKLEVTILHMDQQLLGVVATHMEHMEVIMVQQLGVVVVPQGVIHMGMERHQVIQIMGMEVMVHHRMEVLLHMSHHHHHPHLEAVVPTLVDGVVQEVLQLPHLVNGVHTTTTVEEVIAMLSKLIYSRESSSYS